MIAMPSRFLAAVAFSALAGSGAAIAQDSNTSSAAERMAACMEIADAAQRLACFETAAEALTQPAGDAAVPEPAPAPSVSETPPAPETAEAPAGPALGTPAPAAAPNEAATPMPDVATPSDTMVAAPSNAPAAEALPDWARATRRPEETKDQADELKVSVVRILRNTAGRHFFILSDGQEWEQTMKATVRPPASLPAAATIESAMVGSPRLSFDDGPSGAYKVRRVK